MYTSAGFDRELSEEKASMLTTRLGTTVRT